MNLTIITVLAMTAVLAWLLSGYDPRVTGEDKRADLIRRSVRCGITLIIVGLGASHFAGGAREAFIGVLIMLPMTLIWIGCISELFSGGIVHSVLEANDDREYDSRQSTRDLDRVAGFVREGRNEEAIQLCKQLLDSNEISTLAMDTMLFQLYRETFADDRLTGVPLLAEARRLRALHQFSEAISSLETLLKKDPRNLAAALLVMRIYAQDLNRPDQARGRLQQVRPAHAPPAFAEYARRCVEEWSGAVSRKEKTIEGIESLLVNQRPTPAAPSALNVNAASIDELLAAGHLATAIDILEGKIRSQPQDFDSCLKLAEAHGVYCRDLPRAAKMIEKIVTNAAFNPDQVLLAKAKLKEWREKRA